MQEKLIYWTPSIQNLSKRYYIESISDTRNGFYVILADSIGNSAKVNITFKNGVNAYRKTDETFILGIINFLDKTYEGKFYANWTFFKVENSEYLKWLSEQSGGIADFYGIKHYSLITDDEILDIAGTYEPEVNVIT